VDAICSIDDSVLQEDSLEFDEALKKYEARQEIAMRLKTAVSDLAF
jgi:hypothetical protein